MHKNIVSTNQAPAPVGPYSQAVWAGNLLFLSGQIAIDPASGTLVLDNIEAETHQVMKNIEAMLTAANLTFENIVKTSIFLSDMNDFNSVNIVYGSYFNADTAPARECVEVAKLPKGVNVEISVIAFAA
ncbi:MAG: RidA family protein [Chitinophagales bacterium]